MNESNEEKGPLAQWRKQSTDSKGRVMVAERLEKERLAKEEEDRLAAEAAKAAEGVEPPTLKDIEKLRGPPETEDEKQVYINEEGPGEPEEASEALPEEFQKYMENVSGNTEKKQIKVPLGFEVTKIFYNEDGDATNIIVTRTENIGKYVLMAALVGFVLGILVVFTAYSLPSSITLPW